MTPNYDNYNARTWENANAQPDGEYNVTFNLTISFPADSEEDALDRAGQMFAEQIPGFRDFSDPLDYDYTAERA